MRDLLYIYEELFVNKLINLIILLHCNKLHKLLKLCYSQPYILRTMFYSIIWRLMISPMARDAKRKSESESITFRVERNVLDKLRAEAERKMESVNILGNQIFKEYVDWHSPAAVAGMMYTSKKNLVRIMDKLTEEQINQIVDEHLKDEFVGQVEMITGEYNIISYLRAIENWMSASSIHYRHDVKDQIHIYVILHEMGKKWSYFFECWFKGAFKTLKAKDAEVNATDDTIVLKLSID